MLPLRVPARRPSAAPRPSRSGKRRCAACLLPVLWLAGCVGSDLPTPGNGGAPVRVERHPSGEDIATPSPRPRRLSPPGGAVSSANPNTPDLALLDAALELAPRQPAQAATLLQQLLTEYPQSAYQGEAAYKLGKMLLEMNRATEARRYLDMAAAAPDPLFAGRARQMIADIWPTLTPPPPPVMGTDLPVSPGIPAPGADMPPATLATPSPGTAVALSPPLSSPPPAVIPGDWHQLLRAWLLDDPPLGDDLFLSHAPADGLDAGQAMTLRQVMAQSSDARLGNAAQVLATHASPLQPWFDLALGDRRAAAGDETGARHYWQRAAHHAAPALLTSRSHPSQEARLRLDPGAQGGPGLKIGLLAPLSG
ncbi:MAG: tetratricopeptide repeat protein, partial [Magnetococcus sp. WYHC-3]